MGLLILCFKPQWFWISIGLKSVPAGFQSAEEKREARQYLNIRTVAYFTCYSQFEGLRWCFGGYAWLQRSGPIGALLIQIHAVKEEEEETPGKSLQYFTSSCSPAACCVTPHITVLHSTSVIDFSLKTESQIKISKISR